MYKVKLVGRQSTDFRSVILKKTTVEIDGTQKLIVIINDLTDTVKLEKEQNKKQKDRTTIMV